MILLCPLTKLLSTCQIHYHSRGSLHDQNLFHLPSLSTNYISFGYLWFGNGRLHSLQGEWHSNNQSAVGNDRALFLTHQSTPSSRLFLCRLLQPSYTLSCQKTNVQGAAGTAAPAHPRLHVINFSGLYHDRPPPSHDPRSSPQLRQLHLFHLRRFSRPIATSHELCTAH